MRYITVGLLVASALFGVLVVAAQEPPQAVRLSGAAQPPASPLSLWYRAPASDRPLDPPGASGRDANQEWVRALPVGNGRLGAMVFGGVVHERLQLNEDTLWAGRTGGPHPPLRPVDRRGCAPEIRVVMRDPPAAARRFRACRRAHDARVSARVRR